MASESNIGKINWIDGQRFSIDGCFFNLRTAAGEKVKSESSDFTLVKSKSFLKIYEDLAANIRGKNVLELGVFEGGSLAYFHRRFKPKKVVGIDLRSEAIKPLDEYISQEGADIKIYYGTSQDNETALNTIVKNEFDGPLDFVVDDASHLYEQTRKTFEVVFPKVAPGGIYVIEDWNWSYHKPYQDKNHPWFKKTGMATLLFQLIADVAISDAIDHIEIHRTMAIVKKSANAVNPVNLDRDIYRGRDQPLV